MLSEKLIMEEKIKAICKNDRIVFQKGAVFDKITVLNSDPCDSMLCGPVTFLGHTDSYEMLFSSGNGRYYFTVRDGWGVEDNCLYALSIGAIRRDFKKPVTVEDIEFSVNHPKEPKSTYSALSIGMKLEVDKEILRVMKQYKTVNSLAKSNNQNSETSGTDNVTNIDSQTYRDIVSDLSMVSTAQLVKELSKREAVQKLNIEPYQSYKIKIGRRRISGTGPVVILRVWD